MRNNDPGMAHLVRLFGSHAALARAAGADQGAVHRWPPLNGIGLKYQRRILAAAMDQGLPVHEVLWAMGAKTCSHCGEISDDMLRQQVLAWEKANA